MKAKIVVFSQTGNTWKAGQAISDGLSDSGVEPDLLDIRKTTPEEASNCDLLGLGTPAFSSRAPGFVRRFIADMPHVKGIRAFVFATSGAAPGRTLHDLAAGLTRKGADVAGGIVVRGDIFYPASAIRGRFPGRPNENDLHRARAFGSAVARHCLAKAPGVVPLGNPQMLRFRLRFYDLVATAIGNGPTTRLLLPKPVVNLDRCTRCGWCLAECPVGNIAALDAVQPGRSASAATDA